MNLEQIARKYGMKNKQPKTCYKCGGTATARDKENGGMYRHRSKDMIPAELQGIVDPRVNDRAGLYECSDCILGTDLLSPESPGRLNSVDDMSILKSNISQIMEAEPCDTAFMGECSRKLDKFMKKHGLNYSRDQQKAALFSGVKARSE